MPTATPQPQDYINLADYPIHRPNTPPYRQMLDGIAADIHKKGCAVLHGFVRANKLPHLVDEAAQSARHAYRSFSRTNVYFTKDDETLPPAHPVRRFYNRSNAFVPADSFGSGSILRAVYEWSPFFAFVQAALGEREFYRYADPLADLIVNVVETGGGFPWHFDTNNYTVTLALQNAEHGGLFQYAPHVRGRDEENYAAVQAVLDGSSDAVETLDLRPGDLQLFKGRYTLHRVSEARGNRPRYVAIFSYASRPNMVASAERCQQLYGRTLPIHHQPTEPRADSLLD